MGIVVCATMLLGLLQLLLQWRACAASIAGLLAVFGLWNMLWYGLRHLTEFWGIAAIFSGLAMGLAALIVAGEANLVRHSSASRLKPWRKLICLALLASFLLYATALIRLNLPVGA